jgi:hypothetical protein
MAKAMIRPFIPRIMPFIILPSSKSDSELISGTPGGSRRPLRENKGQVKAW